MFVYLDPDVLAPGFGRSDECGSAAGEGVEDQGAQGGGCFYELLQQLDRLFVWVREALVADLGASVAGLIRLVSFLRKSGGLLPLRRRSGSRASHSSRVPGCRST